MLRGCYELSLLCVLAIASSAIPGYVAHGQETANPSATQATGEFPGIASQPIQGTPLSGAPAILALEHRPAAEMQPGDAAVVAAMSVELSQKARIAGFDTGGAGWEYEQIVCPAFPD